MNSYTKLQSGDWGVRVEGQASVGQTVSVSKRDGSSKSETVAKVIWTGNDTRTGKLVSLCAINASGSGGGSSTRRYSGSRGGRSGRCRGCGGPVVSCSRHRAMGGYCGECAFDEFDM